MHPADQVVAFKELADACRSVSAIASRFGASERIVEKRLRLGNAAPELLDAYRADEIDLEVLKAFAITADRERQMAVWIAWTADPDLYPDSPVSARCLRDAAGGLRKAADLLDAAAEQVEAQHETGRDMRHHAHDCRP